MTRLRLGISTCPNDTFAFHGLLTGAVETPGLDLDFELLDVEELNAGFAAGRFDVAKGSYASALRRSAELIVLPVGSAVGFGVGPVLLSRPGLDLSPEEFAARQGAPPRVLSPGEGTTAHLLFRMAHPELAPPRALVFSEIMPALVRGDADFGVCIHEGRFTWQDSGLGLVEDLGEVWESRTGAPLPLGGLFARADVPEPELRALSVGLRASLAAARSDGAGALATMRRWAQELDEAVILRHIELYVTDLTEDLGRVGRDALERFRDEALRAGLVAPVAAPFRVLDA